MNYENEMTIYFKSNSENEAFARVVVSLFVAQLDPNINEISDIKTSVSEAVTNSIIHGYENIPDGIIKLFCAYKDNIVYIEISDNGRGIDDIEKAMEPLYTTKEKEERSGMGFTVMETFMDTVNVESKKCEGTKVIMTKKIKNISLS